MTYLLLFIALIGNALANICMKLASEKFAHGLRDVWSQPLEVLKNGYLILGLVLFGVALLLYTLVLSRMNLSMAYPIMTSMGFLIVVSFSVWYLDEQLMWWQWFGIAFILVGVLMLSQGR